MEVGNKLGLYTHNCSDRAKHHLTKYKHWCKLIHGVDTTKTNGYAFKGDFLGVALEHKLPIGSIVVEVCGDEIRCYRIGESENKLLFQGQTKKMSSFIDDVATLFKI